MTARPDAELVARAHELAARTGYGVERCMVALQEEERDRREEARDRVAAVVWEPVMAMLEREARGEPSTEAQRGQVAEAAAVIAASRLLRFGASLDSVMDLFVRRDWSARITYSPDRDEVVGIEIVWDDGEVTEIRSQIETSDGD